MEKLLLGTTAIIGVVFDRGSGFGTTRCDHWWPHEELYWLDEPGRRHIAEARVEMEAAGDDQNTIEESYLCLSSNLGRFNIGSEDGANYLLQVAAPSAHANIDGIRQYVQLVCYAAFFSPQRPASTPPDR